MTLTRELVHEIFVADGGVDDWDEMLEAEIRVIVYRELPNALAELVVSEALAVQYARHKAETE